MMGEIGLFLYYITLLLKRQEEKGVIFRDLIIFYVIIEVVLEVKMTKKDKDKTAEVVQGEIVREGRGHGKYGARGGHGARKIKAPMVKKVLKGSGWVALLESVLLGLLGGILIVNPLGTMQAISYVIGVFLIVLGVYKIIGYFATKGMYDVSNNQLLGGVVALLIGIVVMVMWADLAMFFRIIIGIWMIYAALVRMNTSIKLKVAEVPAWGYVLIVAALMMVVGIFILFNAGAAMQLIGWAMVVTAFLGLIDDVIFMRHVDELLAD